MPQTAATKLVYSLDDVEELTGISKSTLYREIRSGGLTVRKVNRRTIVLPDDLQSWLRSLPSGATPVAA